MNSERNKALLRGLRHIARAHEETAKVAAAVGKPKVVISSSISLGITMEAIRVIQDQESEIAALKKQLNEKSAGQRGQQ
ncbi:TPA: hypothetical protein KFO73_003769 [Escherichia coli]|uniref:hypothetical protein n=1 Tax=Escherichia coli TaxID=562 RepID=UPI000BE60F4C|nr:hypothetical protein [Escherichia coli]DAY48764.1 MAG TPA: hypothetical protein [Caudoviricetes sp.]EFK5955737.1 hypothetical protein [Escherichia coli]EFN8265048.1 hypothetical protein [Escherichia coli]EGO4138959.1 hypothetical protein [Escherichia coli]EGO4195206.1 hypothetical protein [Escherichia coli]